jgi:hypothetical protein
MAHFARSRSRSPPDRVSGSTRVFVRTPPFDYQGHLRAWLSCAQHRPTIADGRTYFVMEKKFADFPGQLWMRIEEPYVLHTRGAAYGLEFSLWHGDALPTATRVEMHRGSANQGRALVMNWPGAARGLERVIVSRLIGMSMLFDGSRWHQQGYARFDRRLVVHHLDHVHENCHIRNLVVGVASDHVAHHNRCRGSH